MLNQIAYFINSLNQQPTLAPMIRSYYLGLALIILALFSANTQSQELNVKTLDSSIATDGFVYDTIVHHYFEYAKKVKKSFQERDRDKAKKLRREVISAAKIRRPQWETRLSGLTTFTSVTVKEKVDGTSAICEVQSSENEPELILLSAPCIEDTIVGTQLDESIDAITAGTHSHLTQDGKKQSIQKFEAIDRTGLNTLFETAWKADGRNWRIDRKILKDIDSKQGSVDRTWIVKRMPPFGMEFKGRQAIDTELHFRGKQRLKISIELTPQTVDDCSLVSDARGSGVGLIIENGRFAFKVYGKGGAVYAKQKIKSNQRYSVEVIVDGKDAQLFVDGELQEKKTLNKVTKPNGSPLFIGADPNRKGDGSTHHHFKGQIHAASIEIGDELKVFDMWWYQRKQ